MMKSDERYRSEEAIVPFRDHSTWTRSTVPATDYRPDLPPLVILHGGPGMPHDYSKPMIAFCDDGRKVIHYDQIGCGRSSHLPDAPKTFWNVQLFVDELSNLVDFYGLENGFHLLGQSWGGMLGPEYVLQRPERVLSMTLSNSPASMPLWTEGTSRLIEELPTDVQTQIRKHEVAGTTSHQEYLDAVDFFYHKHLCRLDPFPQDLTDSIERMAADPTVYNTMIGPSEFTITGSLKEWTVIDRLHQIVTPTLVVAGEFDEARPIAWRPFVERMPNASSYVFPNASHTPHLECPEEYFRVVGEFLRTNDNN